MYSKVSAEEQVAGQLSQLNPEVYRLLNDLMLPAVHGRFDTTQIDHVLISKYAIFVIETKANKGAIYGASWRNYLTEYFFKKESKVYNPFFQNVGHIKAIEKAIRPYSSLIPVVSVAVFPNAKRTKVCCRGNYIIATLDKLLDKIKSYDKAYLPYGGVDVIECLLLNANITEEEYREKHNSTVGEYVAQKAENNVEVEPVVKKAPRKTGRFTGIDRVYDLRGQLTACVACNLEYLTEDAVREDWPFNERHCKRCGNWKLRRMA